ncbi:hypothetical protein [Photobacterium phosphoreum]|uniref:hypothetical protein n=1 Tax=Photobacterium phosphoreum TaxID=659 RepID=UPI0024B69E81|nr:hypothetical protein [Photobacterium phosphoreum]
MDENIKKNKDSNGFFHFMTELSVIQTLVLTVIAVLFPALKSVDFLDRLRSLDFDGLLLYQTMFASIAVVSAFFILYVVSKLATSETACSTFKKYFYYLLSCLLIFVFSLSLREFYAPTSSFTSYVIGKEVKVNYGLIQVESGLEYEIQTCSKSGKLIQCNLTVSNKTDEDYNVARFDQIFFYDQSNSKGVLEKVIFDNQKVGRFSEIHLTKKSSTNLVLYFKMSAKSNTNLVKKLLINFHYFGENRSVIFRNLKIESAK